MWRKRFVTWWEKIIDSRTAANRARGRNAEELVVAGVTDGAATAGDGFLSNDIGLQTGGSKHLYAFALVITLVAALAFLLMTASRAGLGDPLGGVMILAFFCILPPWICAWAISLFPGTPLKAACAGCAGYLAATLLPIAGLANAPIALAAGPAIFLLAVWGGRTVLLATALENLGGKTFIILLSAVFVLLLTAPVRLYLPEAMLMGLSSPDAYYHATLAQMVLHHGVFSIGADGLDRNRYHFLSHFIAAGLSKTSGLSVPLVYAYWGAIGLKLAPLSAFFYASLFFFRPDMGTSRQTLFWTLLFAWLAVVLTGAPESESYMLGVALLVSALPLLLLLMSPGEKITAVAGVIAILAVMLCAAGKISFGFYGGIALAIAAWHHRGDKRALAVLGAGLLLLAGFAYFFILAANGGMTGADWRILASSYLMYLNWRTLASYGLLILVILLLIYRPAITYKAEVGGANLRLETAPPSNTPPSSLRQAIDWFLSADGVLQFAILALLGCVAVLLTQPIGDDMEYFSLPLYAVAIILLPFAIGARSAFSVSNVVVKWAAGILLAINIIPRVEPFEADMHKTLLDIQTAALGKTSASHPLSAAIKDALHAHKPPLYVLEQQIASSPRAHLVTELRQRADRAQGQLAVQVSPDATEIWEWAKPGTPIWCTAGHLVVPAETGILEIRSVAPDKVERQCMPPNMAWYGYGKQQDSHRSLPLGDEKLCSLARAMKVTEVYRLTSYSDLSRNRQVNCS